MFTIVPKVPNKQQKCLLPWSANYHNGFTLPLQAALSTGSKWYLQGVLYFSTQMINTYQIVQTGTKKSAMNISKLQEKKAVEHCDLALLLQRNQ